MEIIEAEEVGNILARLVMADESLATLLVQCAQDAGDKMLPNDVQKLQSWLHFMRILSACLK